MPKLLKARLTLARGDSFEIMGDLNGVAITVRSGGPKMRKGRKGHGGQVVLIVSHPMGTEVRRVLAAKSLDSANASMASSPT